MALGRPLQLSLVGGSLASIALRAAEASIQAVLAAGGPRRAPSRGSKRLHPPCISTNHTTRTTLSPRCLTTELTASR
eukprot:s3241_g13.t1